MTITASRFHQLYLVTQWIAMVESWHRSNRAGHHCQQNQESAGCNRNGLHNDYQQKNYDYA